MITSRDLPMYCITFKKPFRLDAGACITGSKSNGKACHQQDRTHGSGACKHLGERDAEGWAVVYSLTEMVADRLCNTQPFEDGDADEVKLRELPSWTVPGSGNLDGR